MGTFPSNWSKSTASSLPVSVRADEVCWLMTSAADLKTFSCPLLVCVCSQETEAWTLWSRQSAVLLRFITLCLVVGSLTVVVVFTPHVWLVRWLRRTKHGADPPPSSGPTLWARSRTCRAEWSGRQTWTLNCVEARLPACDCSRSKAHYVCSTVMLC